MQIDWLTVSAQIVNFLVLVLLLRWALYRPLARALQARQEAVAQRLTEAEQARAKAEAAAEEHRAAIHALEQARHDRLLAAEAEAEVRRSALVDAAKAEVTAQRTAWQAQIAEEKSAFLDRLRHRAGDSFVIMARNILSEMADQDLVDRMARTFAARLGGLAQADRDRLRQAFDAGKPPEIHASLPLSEAARGTVAAALGDLLGKPVTPVFAEDPDLPCGLVLRLGAQHVGWTISDHLDRFAQEVSTLLDGTQAQTETQEDA
ncbi:hypothetical protein [Aquicoccus sp. SU-CL01552]|uniref:F0F1 ATP synthase subunit B family protein n=1 Tax=Aquicoccus sp. SU-CL01552 TaxID=3127656 RepID=UPI0031031C42